ncbi:MAG: glycosyltransferase family 4 protein [Nitrospirae bacterium]|nr:glycosyltransferase family 4 protein [Nitrospirota bacterium]
MNILFLPKYYKKAASCRYRFLQFIPYFEHAGIRCVVSPLFDDNYLEIKYQTGKNDIFEVVKAFMRRLKTLLHVNKYDLVVIHCEVFPYFSLFEKYLILRKIKYIFDYDDAIFHNYDNSHFFIVRWLFRDKISAIIKGAEYVITGSKYLADYALRFNNNVEVFPTVIDNNKYKKIKVERTLSSLFTIGWIGSPSTSKYVEGIETALAEICKDGFAKVILIGAGKVNLSGVNYQNIEWSDDNEIRNIQLCDVGIMPLHDDLWEKGKCGFKLIQYMACGLPVVASPVGVNCELVKEGKNGFLATTTEEWIRALNILRYDFDLRQRFGRYGRQMVEKYYSLQIMAPRYVALLEKVICKNENFDN